MQLAIVAALGLGWAASDPEEHRHGADRWMSAWAWGENGNALVFSFSGTDAISQDAATSGTDAASSVVPILQLTEKMHLSSPEWWKGAPIFRGWTSTSRCPEDYRQPSKLQAADPVWHFVRLPGYPMSSADTYAYRFGLEVGGVSLWLSQERRLRVQRPSPTSSVRMAVICDFNHRQGGKATLEFIEDRMAEAAAGGSGFDAVLSLGDASYAETCQAVYKDWKRGAGVKGLHRCEHWQGGYQEFLREYFTELSRLSGQIPTLNVAGNHDTVCQFADYVARSAGMPYRESMSPSPLYWAMQLGPAYIISIFSERNVQGIGFPQLDFFIEDYLKDDAEKEEWSWTSAFAAKIQARWELQQHQRGRGKHSDQVQWLEEQLKKAWQMKKDGQITWIVVLSHRNSGFGAYCSVNHCECLNSTDDSQNYFHLHHLLERLFFKYEVDLHLSGHMHCYERSAPVYRFKERFDVQEDAAASFAPVYVVGPAGSDLHPEKVDEADPAVYFTPRPSHLVQRLPGAVWGHIELTATPSKLQLELFGRKRQQYDAADLGHEPPAELLDSVEFSTSSRSHRRTELVAEVLGGAHEAPVDRGARERCRAAIRQGAHLNMVWQFPSERGAFASACLERRQGIFWRILFSTVGFKRWFEAGHPEIKLTVPDIIDEHRFWIGLAFFDYMREAAQERYFKELLAGRAVSLEQVDFWEQPPFLEFGICLPAACDWTDLAGAVALPALLNHTAPFKFMPVGFADYWFETSYIHATRCPDVASATRAGVFEGGEGVEVPAVDLVDPTLMTEGRLHTQ